jgi:hypothetical protein
MFCFDPFIVYINESSTSVKTYGKQMRCYWEHLGEHISTNKRINKKIAPKKTQKKKTGPSSGHALIGHMKNYGPKTVGHHFQPGVSPPTANGGESRAWVYI